MSVSGGSVTQTRWARVIRGTSAAVFATAAAAVSHGLAGGSAPSLFGVMAAFVLAAAVCTTLAGRTVSLPRMAIAVTLSQWLFHSLFAGLGSPQALSHQHATPFAVDEGMLLGSSTAAMWLGHAVAAVLTVLALAYGEAAFWGIAVTARLLVLRALAVVPVVIRTPRVVVATRTSPIPGFTVLLSPMRHRGPPAAAVAA